jgi:dCMP deaminase
MTKWDKLFMDLALRIAEESKSINLKVGCVLVRENRVVGSGINGLPTGFEPDVLEGEDGKDTIDTIHSELNAYLDCAKRGVSTNGCTLYVNYSPCRACSSMTRMAGIVKVKYLNEYRDQTGIERLKDYGVKVEKLSYD